MYSPKHLDTISEMPLERIELLTKVWIDRYIELISERLNTNSMKVKRLLDSNCNDEIFNKIILTLALCISDDGFLKLRTTLLNY